jgi:hypothetical protein
VITHNSLTIRRGQESKILTCRISLFKRKSRSPIVLVYTLYFR